MLTRRMHRGDAEPGGWRADAGAAAVEMALVLPVLVLLLGGIIDFGFAFNAQIGLTHAAREGVRVEAIGSGDAVSTAEAAFTAPGVTGGAATVTAACTAAGDRAELTMTAQYGFFFLPFGDRPLVGQAVMRCGG